MGLVLKEDKALGIVVEQVVEGGNAAKGGDVQAGDILSRCAAQPMACAFSEQPLMADVQRTSRISTVNVAGSAQSF